MGGKGKTGGKQQGKSKGQANGGHEKSSVSPQSNKTSQAGHAQKGGDKGKSLKSGQDTSSPGASRSQPASRLPWRLILLLSIVAGGLAVMCVNEPARSAVEDVYLRHIKPQVHRISEVLSSGLASVQQMIQGSSPASSPHSGEDPSSQPTKAPQREPTPVDSSGSGRAKRDAPESVPSSSPATAATTPPPPSSNAPSDKPSQRNEQGRADELQQKQAHQPDKDKNVKLDKSEAEKDKDKKVKSEKSEAGKDREKAPDQKAADKEAAKRESQERTPETSKSSEATGEKTASPDGPAPESQTKAETPTQPVVEEIRVKTTPKAETKKPGNKEPTSGGKNEADRTTKTQGKESEKQTQQAPNAAQKQEDKQTQKASEKQKEVKVDEKSAEKPAEKEGKPAHKSPEKTDPKPPEKSGGKADEKVPQKTPDGKLSGAEMTGGDSSAPNHSEKTQPKNLEKEYSKAAITNEADFKIRDKLDEAEELLQKKNHDEALRKFEALLRKYPKSPRAQLGRADALDEIASVRRSNEILEQCILGYERLIYHGEDVMPELMKTAGRRLAKKQQFRGWGAKAARTMQFLVENFPTDLALQREQGVNHLLVGQDEEARKIFRKLLEVSPDDGFALVHMGFIVKTTDSDPKGAIPLLQRGIDSGQEGTQDGRFYFHLGDAYQRVGRPQEARQIYQQGAERGLFLSADQRSLYNVDRLKSRPWWTKEQTRYLPFLKLLEDNWQVIRDEGLQQLDSKSGFFRPEAESLREKGDWKQLTMYQQGRRNKKVCEKVPKTCALIDQIPDAKGCKRGQVKFSVMQPGVHVWPHCGPTNCRIRAHLGLVIPEGPRIRVTNETRTWKEGEFIIFDDSFEHEVWHDGKSVRLVLIVDFWHPDLTEAEKRSLVPI